MTIVAYGLLHLTFAFVFVLLSFFTAIAGSSTSQVCILQFSMQTIHAYYPFIDYLGSYVDYIVHFTWWVNLIEFCCNCEDMVDSWICVMLTTRTGARYTCFSRRKDTTTSPWYVFDVTIKKHERIECKWCEKIAMIAVACIIHLN